ncbi:CocE/NonD family hydrolase [soil metagenome]
MHRLRLWLVCGLLLINSIGFLRADDTTATATAARLDFNQRVPMRDGVTLSADVYRPTADGKYPVILMRTPYNKVGDARSAARFKAIAARGYVVVNQDVRGRGDSGGVYEPWRREGLDGYDTIEWCAAQPWSNGKVGTVGGSYLGYDQWVAAVQQPPHLVTMIPLVSPSDPFVEDPSGLPTPMNISWYHFTDQHANQNMDAVDWSKVHKHLPMVEMDDVTGRHMPFWKELFKHTQLDDWWEPCRYQNQFHKVNIPVLHISGWYDDEQIGTPLNYHGMTNKPNGGKRTYQKLLMGPWPHRVNSTSKLGKVDFGASAIIDLDGLQMRWFDHFLKGVDNGIEKEPEVRIFVMGANEWRDEKEWPLARTEWTKYYLHSNGHANTLKGDGKLSTEVPKTQPADQYTYDPTKPTPFLTEPSFAQIGGPDDYREVEARPDVLVYTTDELSTDTEVTGPIKAKIFAASSAPDTDFMVKLIDVWPDGFAQRLCDGMVRARFREGMAKPSLIEPGKVYAYDVDCWNTCQVFKKGHRIRVEVASSAFPKFSLNLNTGAALGLTKEMKSAQQTILHDAEHASHIVLPIIPASKK